MTIEEMIARQQAIVTAARNDGERSLSSEEQAEFDSLQAQIDAARSAGDPAPAKIGRAHV